MHACHSHGTCVEDALKKADKLCADKGLRLTELRRKVLEMIWQSHEPAKAYDLLDKIKGEGTAGPPTVYRALDFLIENGLAHKLSSLNAYVGCSHPSKHEECYFLICVQCAEIKECCSSKLSEAIGEVAAKNHFRAAHTTLEIAGLCQACAKKAGQ